MTGRHYGCYLAHRMALETMDTENFDYTLVFEADAFIYTGLKEFVEIVHRACFLSERDNVPFISFADNPSREKIKIDELFSKTAPNQDLAHCYLIPNREKQWWMDRLVDCGWDVGDLWFNHVFYNHSRPRYTTNKMYSKQAEGFSLLDLTVKTWS
jgi:GR25 family glycosyltransferase involved in LPS biosynthesis